jgi:sulfur relay (sulfurtransferase) complex TusBCD TusD component (DsrE family)|tara:strand:+ start:519 stop:839 length:321 start_codon:yes stop_codon:yes gene_type:complete
MKVGIVISQIDPETVWNAFRFANFSLGKNHEVRTFLIGKGVECVEIINDEFNVVEQMNKYVENKGQIFACGTCLVSRNKEGSPICPMSTMNDLMELVEESDKVVSF